MWGVNIFRCFIKSVNFETDNKSPRNNGLTEEFYKDFLNELAAVLLDVYGSWGKGGTSRTGISIKFYIKKVIKKILQNYRLIST